MYEFDARIRYSEVDSEGRLTWIALLNYFQDVSTFQSEEGGAGVSYLMERNLAWVLNSWQIDVIRYPMLFEYVKVGTIPYGIKGFLGYRNFYLKDAATNEMAAVANSLWTLMDMEKMVPCRVTKEIAAAYPMEEKLSMEYADRKIFFTGEGTKKEEILVRPHHLDTNQHVNNGQYVLMAMDFLPPGFEIQRLRAEYKKSALLSDVIVPIVYESEKCVGIALQTTDEKVYANVEFCGIKK